MNSMCLNLGSPRKAQVYSVPFQPAVQLQTEARMREEREEGRKGGRPNTRARLGWVQVLNKYSGLLLSLLTVQAGGSRRRDHRLPSPLAARARGIFRLPPRPFLVAPSGPSRDRKGSQMVLQPGRWARAQGASRCRRCCRRGSGPTGEPAARAGAQWTRGVSGSSGNKEFLGQGLRAGGMSHEESPVESCPLVTGGLGASAAEGLVWTETEVHRDPHLALRP